MTPSPVPVLSWTRHRRPSRSSSNKYWKRTISEIFLNSPPSRNYSPSTPLIIVKISIEVEFIKTFLKVQNLCNNLVFLKVTRSHLTGSQVVKDIKSPVQIEDPANSSLFSVLSEKPAETKSPESSKKKLKTIKTPKDLRKKLKSKKSSKDSEEAQIANSARTETDDSDNDDYGKAKFLPRTKTNSFCSYKRFVRLFWRNRSAKQSARF